MTTNPTPTLGRIVLALVDPRTNNGADLAPAVITRVWPTPRPVLYHAVNYRVISDDIPRAEEWKTSAKLYADEATARAALNVDGGHRTGMHAFWPPRIDTEAKPQHVMHDPGSAPVSQPAQGLDKGVLSGTIQPPLPHQVATA